jgi:hypothetical protein
MEKEMNIPLGVVLRRRPGVTRWAAWAWSAEAVVPGASGDWKVLREEDGVTDWLVAARPLELHRSEVEGYRISLMMKSPSLFVVLNKGADAKNEHGIAVHLVTASADLAQEYQDSDEVIVEPVAMPPGLVGTIRDFCEAHYVYEPFKKRKRDRVRVDKREDGRGDARIRQTADVYRAPSSMKRGLDN